MKLKPLHHSLLISLSTYPNFQTDNYLDAFVSNLEKIKIKRENIFNTKYPCYFKHLVYTLWGFWDVCLLTVIDNAEIISEPIHPEFNEDYRIEGQSSSKMYSGISFEGIGTNLFDISMSKNTDHHFMGMVNLKLASKWLLPNGQKLSYRIFDHINILLKNFVFFPIHTFNTYEISIVILGNNLNDIFEKIFQIREMKVSTIFDNNELKKTAGYILNEQESHLFVDSQSYYGTRLVRKDDYSNNPGPMWDLIPNIKFDNIKAIFEVEAKPGHAKDLEVALNSIVKLENRIIRFQTGLYDFFINWDFNSEAFISLFDELRNVNSELRIHIKKFKTRVLFEYSTNEELFDKLENQILNEYFDLSKIENSLVKIKVSRSLRSQIMKLFSSFRDSFLNKVTYSTFIDLFYFVKNLEKKITEYENQVNTFFSSETSIKFRAPIMKIESQLSAFVETYKDSFYLRYVNDRNTDVQDFLIPYNAQLQTIISFYDSYAKCILSSLVDSEYGNSFILTFDDHVTSVNELNIKLLSTNLFEPGLIFTALSKELTTICSANIENTDYKIDIKDAINGLKNNINEYFLQRPDSIYTIQKDNLINFDYHYGVIDYLRFKYFFDRDFNLYLFYNIGFILQYPKVYENTGSIDEHQLFYEIQRLVILIMMIKIFPEPDDKKIDYFLILKEMYIPPEIRSIWDYHLVRVHDFIADYEESSESGKKISLILENLILDREYVLHFDKLNTSSAEETPTANEYIELSCRYMKNIYNKSNIIQTVSRDWKTGQINIDFLNMKKKVNAPYFLFDSQGGVFFIEYENMVEFLEIRNQTFEDLRHMSTIYKSNLYKKIISDEQSKSLKLR